MDCAASLELRCEIVWELCERVRENILHIQSEVSSYYD